MIIKLLRGYLIFLIHDLSFKLLVLGIVFYANASPALFYNLYKPNMRRATILLF